MSMFKKLCFYIVLITFITVFGFNLANADFGGSGFSGGSGTGVSTAKDCNVAAYYPIGKLCQDTDDGKLYKGTGSAVAEIDALTLLGDVVVVSDSGTGNISTDKMRGQVHNITGAYTLSLPTAAIGYNARFFASTAAAYSIDVVTGTDIIVLNGTALTAGYKATSDGTIDAAIYCECIVAGKYICTATQGLFIDGGGA